MKLRVYVDNSVVGGCDDEEFRDHSKRLMACFAKGDLILVLSSLTLQELAAAPDRVRLHLAAVPEEHIEALSLTAAASELAQAYIDQGVISPRMRADAQHIAIASVARVDVLVSWNFKHIVNLRRIHGYNSVNLRMGYPTLEIRAPREVLPDE
jgi:predicted nucleic acid-binding protein